MFPTDKAEPNPSVGRILVKAGEENAGVVDIGDGWGICFKIESHNHLASLNLLKVLQQVLAESFATSLPWALAQPTD